MKKCVCGNDWTLSDWFTVVPEDNNIFVTCLHCGRVFEEKELRYGS